MAPIRDVEAQPGAPRAADRRMAEADGNITPEMERDLGATRAATQKVVVAHRAALADTVFDGGIWLQAEEIDRAAERTGRSS